MRFGTFALASILPVALNACGQSETAEVSNAAANEVAPADDAAAVAPSGAQDFANKLAAGDRFAIESSQLVASSAASSVVMAYARTLIAAHMDSTAKLKSAVANDPSIAINDQLNASQQATIEDMKSKKGYIFDAAYLAAHVHGLDQTLTDLKNYAASGDNASLKAFAQGQIPAVTEQLDNAKALSEGLGK
jgi:putative membrane protein